MPFSRVLVNQDHTHQLVVTTDVDGWEIREEEDANVLSQIRRDDWHRVERDMQLFETRAAALKRDGWVER